MIRLSGVTYAYAGGARVLSDVTLDFPPGLTLLLGPNGSGKSTLMKLAAGVEKPDSGTISVEGRDMWGEEAGARRRLAYVPEQPDLTPYATVEEILRLVARLRGEPLTAASAALDRCGLAGLGRRSIRELSMGQRRRAVLAAAMIGSPREILLDEPLEALDRQMREAVLAWITAHHRDGATLVVVTHEMEPFAAVARQGVTVRRGRAETRDLASLSAEEKRPILDSLARSAE